MESLLVIDTFGIQLSRRSHDLETGLVLAAGVRKLLPTHVRQKLQDGLVPLHDLVAKNRVAVKHTQPETLDLTWGNEYTTSTFININSYC